MGTSLQLGCEPLVYTHGNCQVEMISFRDVEMKVREIRTVSSSQKVLNMGPMLHTPEPIPLPWEVTPHLTGGQLDLKNK